jgi:competence protein ComEC
LIGTVAASALTLPLTLIYFGQFSTVMLLANLLIVPAQAVLLLLGVIGVALGMVWPPLGVPVLWAAALPVSWTLGAVNTLAAWPSAAVAWPLDPLWGGIALITVVGLMMAQQGAPRWWGRLWRRRLTGALVGICGVLLLWIGMAWAGRPDGQLHLWLLDSGHSNAVLLRTPNGAHLLIDGGRYPNRLSAAVGQILPWGAQTLDLVILTQPDQNDYAALTTLSQRYRVGALLTHGQPNLRLSYQTLMERWGAMAQVVQRGDQVQIDGVTLTILHPAAAPSLTASQNDHALTVRVDYGEQGWLLAGDLSVAGQAALIAANQPLAATVLQLPAHGERASLDARFLAAVQPSVALVSVESDHVAGDPQPSVLALLGETLPLWRTDQSGPIHLWTDGQALWLKPERNAE